MSDGPGLNRKQKTPGIGSNKRGKSGQIYAGFRRIVTAFDEETFDEIRALAVKHERSFAEQVRILVEWGLETDEVTTKPQERTG